MAQSSTWERFLAAIRAQETGGNYAQDSAGCLGAYCWSNQASWDNMAAAAGQHQYVGQNPATLPPQVQDTVASDNLSRAYHSAGNSLLRAAEWWNGGQTHSVPNPGLPAQTWAHNCGGGSSQAYACQVLTRMQLGGHFLAGSGGPSSPQSSGSGGTVTTSTQAQCIIGFGGIPGTSWIEDIFGNGGNIGQVCLLTRPEARALIGAAILVMGGLVVLPGLFLIFAGIGAQFRGPVGKAAETTGAMVALIPGLEGAGVATAVAGRSVNRSAEQTKARRDARRQARREGQPELHQDETTGTGHTDEEIAAA